MAAGSVVSDCHAEVLSRRAFLKFVMECVARGEEHVIKGATFYPKMHFYSSALPCGDCSIIPMAVPVEPHRTEPDVKRPKLTSGLLDDFKSERSVEGHLSDIYRTGARPVVTGSDLKLPGEMFHTIGIGRTKGGRGPESWSMSCSDKLAKWNYCGFQGAVLSHLIPCPIIPASVSFGPCEFDAAAIRSSLARVDETTFDLNFVAEPPFAFSPKAVSAARISNTIPVTSASSALIWQKFMQKPEQLDGKRGVRHGVGKSQKALQRRKSHSAFAPKYLFEFFATLPNAPKFEDYAAAKSAAKEYNARLRQVEKSITWKKTRMVERELDRFSAA